MHFFTIKLFFGLNCLSKMVSYMEITCFKLFHFYVEGIFFLFILSFGIAVGIYERTGGQIINFIIDPPCWWRGRGWVLFGCERGAHFLFISDHLQHFECA